jgi:hypothetical protein
MASARTYRAPVPKKPLQNTAGEIAARRSFLLSQGHLESAGPRSSSGSLAKFAAMRRASSRVSRLVTGCRAGLIIKIKVRQRLPGGVLDEKAFFQLLDGPGRETALPHRERAAAVRQRQNMNVTATISRTATAIIRSSMSSWPRRASLFWLCTIWAGMDGLPFSL